MSQDKQYILININSGYFVKFNDLKSAVQSLRESFESKGIPIRILPILPDKFELVAKIGFKKSRGKGFVWICGGDGTIRGMISFSIQYNVALKILAGGTMNIYANQLGISPDFDQAITSLSSGKAQYVDVGVIEGEYFLGCAMFGISSSLAAVRENFRNNSPITELIPQLQSVYEQSLDNRIFRYVVQTKKRNFSVSSDVNAISMFKAKSKFGQTMIRSNWTSKYFYIYTYKSGGVLGMIEIFISIVMGNWVKSPKVRCVKLRDFSMECLSGDSVEMLLDGEIFKFQNPVLVNKLSNQLQLVFPEPEN